MNELCTQLDWRGDSRQAARQAAAAQSVSCFDHQDGPASARERIGRGQARGAGADDQDVYAFLNRRASQGTMISSAVSASSEAEIGWVMNTVASPWLMDSARRNWVSASGPRIRPITAGPTGMSQRRMAKPSRPNT